MRPHDSRRERPEEGILTTRYNTGARVCEVTGLRVADVLTDRAPALHLHNKGRKERVIQLWKTTAAQLRAWLPHIDPSRGTPVFPNRAGVSPPRSSVEPRLGVALATTSKRYPSLAGRRVSPHTHTTAMHPLQSGVDITVIALWLGHEDPTTTHYCREADLAMKEAALRRVADPGSKALRFRACDRLLASLEAL